MNSCESYEIHISALIDGETSRADTLAILDHLPGCDSCLAFYRDCREFQDAVDARPADAVAASAASAPAAVRQLVVPITRRSRWIWAAAASIAVFFVAATIGLRPSSGGLGLDPDARVIDLSTLKPSRPMDDARFMEISVALLQAKPRYQRSMIEILQRFERSRGLDEGSVDVAAGDMEVDEMLFGDENGDEPNTDPVRGTTLQP